MSVPDEILADMRAAELASLPASEWGRALAAKVAQLEKEAAELRPLAKIAAAARKRSWFSLGGTLAALLTAGTALIAWVDRRGEARGDARAERAAIATDHRALAAVIEHMNVLAQDLARLEGEVRGLYPLRAMPVYGPRPAPQPSPE